jgi:hypothetical protein
METKTETLTMPAMHVYHLTADPRNDTGYTIEEITKIVEENGAEYQMEVTVTTPLPGT